MLLILLMEAARPPGVLDPLDVDFLVIGDSVGGGIAAWPSRFLLVPEGGLMVLPGTAYGMAANFFADLRSSPGLIESGGTI